MKTKDILTRVASSVLATAMTVTIALNIPVYVYAAESGKSITADIYELDEDSKYEFSSSQANASATAAGVLSVNGERYSSVNDNGFTDFAVTKNYTDENTDYNLSFSYAYRNKLLSASDENWHLVSDNGKRVDYIALESKIENGAIIVQTSKDGKVWVTSYTDTDIFEKYPNGMEAFYKTTDVQLAAGCYYRVIVAYELSKKVDSSKILLWNKDEYESKKVVEVFKIHAYDVGSQSIVISPNTLKYNMGTRVRTEKFDGYYGEAEMEKGDPHYGWDLGQFFVCGYTDTSLDRDGNVVFLKNTGDQVSLWFNLQQPLDCLNNNPALKIEADTAGYDQYFETPTTNFGYGALIIRKINSENTRETAQIYTDYLLASASAGADTMVSMFEEGDYEVALDYAIKHDKTVVFGASILPGESHYRIYFKFSVRNSNSMFFLRDLKTTSELANNSITTNGFYIDLAGSKYLNLSYIRESLSPGANRLNEDIRENKAAKDGDSFTKEGIYTITVTNSSTGKETTKRIYVGDDKIIKAYMVTGLSIGEIRDRVANGSTIAEDGNIIDPIIKEEETNTFIDTTVVENADTSIGTATQKNADDQEKTESFPAVPIALGSVVVIAGVFFAVNQSRKCKKPQREE